MIRFGWLLAAALLATIVGPAIAHEHGGPSGHRHGASALRSDSASTRDFKLAHEAMMKAMDLPYTGDPDVDFRVHMIPHHAGAIAMARVALRHATDPWTRQLAEAIIVEQQREIADMQAWLARHGVAAPDSGQPQHIVGASSYRKHDEEAGTRDEAAGQSWAPGSGIRP